MVTTIQVSETTLQMLKKLNESMNCATYDALISSLLKEKTSKGKKKSAKMLLKSAYEKKAKRFIQIGNLGLARKTLRKKNTVV